MVKLNSARLLRLRSRSLKVSDRVASLFLQFLHNQTFLDNNWFCIKQCRQNSLFRTALHSIAAEGRPTWKANLWPTFLSASFSAPTWMLFSAFLRARMVLTALRHFLFQRK